MTKAPHAALNFAPAAVDIETLGNGTRILRSPQVLDPYPGSVIQPLRRWADREPSRIFLAERSRDRDWRKLSYQETLASITAISQAFLDRGLLNENHRFTSTVAILSDNGIDNALIQLAAMQIGVPVVPVSPAYSLMSKDHARLKYILDIVSPGLVYAEDGQRFEGALAVAAEKGCEVVVGNHPPSGISTTPFASLEGTPPSEAVETAYRHVTPESTAKILFTSGSTGSPKGVINTQRMLCSNQQAIGQIWPFLKKRPQTILDWLPWNHTFGGNHNFNMMLFNGGTIYIDDGKPAPGLIERTVANLREISPTLYFNVPRGFDMLLPYLEKDPALQDRFFRNLDLIFYAGAALPENLWKRLETLAIRSRGERVHMVSAWGSTETAPMVTSVHFPIDRAGVIGLPAPGSELKMVPGSGKLELRVKGPNVTPGYYKDPELTAASFDENGYYCIGDAGKLADDNRPEKGIVFDGRVSENFKLASGSWVHVGTLRLDLISAVAPVIQDAVITGHDRDELGLLVFPNPMGCKSLCPDLTEEISLPDLIRRPEVRERVEKGLTEHNRRHRGSSRQVTRVLLMCEPPDIDANEITDKGYINQRAVLDRRVDLVERLYAADATEPVLIIPD